MQFVLYCIIENWLVRLLDVVIVEYCLARLDESIQELCIRGCDFLSFVHIGCTYTLVQLLDILIISWIIN